MKIVYFLDTLPPHYDGVVKTFCHLAEVLKSEGVDFRMYSCFKPGNQYDWTDRVYNVSYVPLILYRDYRMGLPYFDRIYPELDKFKPDLLHAVDPTPLSHYGVNYARKRKIKAVASYHSDYISYLPYYRFPRMAIKLGLFLQRRFFSRFDMVYVPSRSAVDDMRRLGIKNIKIWERGVELDRFSPAFRNQDIRKSIKAEDRPILLYVGRLIKEKDLKDLVTANSVLREKGCVYKLVLVGDGPLRKHLQRKLPDAHFTGFLRGEKLSQWYASSDLLVFPSTTETFGNVIVEAFASGIPAVVVNKGGATELIIDGVNGLIAKARSPRDFAEKIEYFLKNKEALKHMGDAARNTVKKRKSWQAANLELLKSYEQVLMSPKE
jgi:glycosyltransferase involved in cell wall biosynthesis